VERRIQTSLENNNDKDVEESDDQIKTRASNENLKTGFKL
jgi:hypothetical protein